MIQLAKRPGPRAFSAATSPATPSATSAAMVASQRSRSTASAAATSAEPAQPMAVTSPISGSPLAIVARPLAVGHHVGRAGQRDDRVVGFGKARRRVARGIAAGKRRRIRA